MNMDKTTKLTLFLNPCPREPRCSLTVVRTQFNPDLIQLQEMNETRWVFWDEGGILSCELLKIKWQTKPEDIAGVL